MAKETGPLPCPHGVARLKCPACDAERECCHKRRKDLCPQCGEGFPCEHGKVRRQCRECKGSAFCPHGRRRSRCVHCGGSSLCKHSKRKERCRECGGSAYCGHGKRKDRCFACARNKACKKCSKGNGRCFDCMTRLNDAVDTKCRPCQGTGNCEHCGGVGLCGILTQTQPCNLCKAQEREKVWLQGNLPNFLPLPTLPALGSPILSPSHGLPYSAELISTPLGGANKALKTNKVLLWENAGMS